MPSVTAYANDSTAACSCSSSRSRRSEIRRRAISGKRSVRGIVLCEEPPENLSYTAAAVADTVAFKTYRLALSFDDIEI